MESFRLTKEQAHSLAEQYTTPLAVVSVKKIAENYRFLKKYLPGIKVFYAVKANPADPIIQTLAGLGSAFDVASDGEMLQLTRLGIGSERMIYANPFKTPKGLATAKNLGVNKFTYDSESEIDKMAETVPGGAVLLRVRVDNPKALVDLNKKFGAAPEDALTLLRKARDQGLQTVGLCFHVGSQSSSAQAHQTALRICRQIFDAAKSEGFHLSVLDIGGGLPIPSLDAEIDVVKMAREINEAIEALFPDTEIWMEPGRFICGTAMNLLTSVIGTQTRNQQKWYFLDDGLYGSFSGIIFDHWEYQLKSFKEGKAYPVIFAGPSCDSLDILFRDKLSPELAIGDLLLVPDCGAYTTASATEFNGFAKTELIVWEDVMKK